MNGSTTDETPCIPTSDAHGERELLTAKLVDMVERGSIESHNPTRRMSYRGLQELHAGLVALGHLSGELGLAVARNTRLARDILSDVEAATAVGQDLQDYIKAGRELHQKHAKKDERGRPVVSKEAGREPWVIEDLAALQEEQTALEAQHAEAITAHKEKQKLWDRELLDGEFVLRRVPQQQAVDAGLTAEQLTPILPMLDDD